MLIDRLKRLVPNSLRDDSSGPEVFVGMPPNQVKPEYYEYPVRDPNDHPSDHNSFWTGAIGIWYCRDCHQWYRVWSDDEEPYRPKRQKEGR